MADIDVTLCPDCEERGTVSHGRYEGRVLINGRGFYTCPTCGCRWQNEQETPTDKGLVVEHIDSKASS